MAEDHRRRTRVELGEIKALLETAGRSDRVTINNLSLKGLLCSTHEHFRQGADCRVVITLSEEVVISVQGRIVRTDEHEAAVDFLGMDENSFSHLHRLVQLHADDPDQIDEEMVHPAFPPKG